VHLSEKKCYPHGAFQKPGHQKVHLEIQNLVQEIEKMVGGWLKFVPTEKSPSGK
jgi:hypothetical protein